MSAFSGPQPYHDGPPSRVHRERKRREAEARQAAYDKQVQAFAADRGIRDLDEARGTMRRERREDYQTNAEIVDAFLGGEPLRCATLDGAA